MVHNDQSSEVRFVGNSHAARTIRAEIDFAAGSDAKVLITGETGVGKDVVASLIHRQSARRLRPLALVNCAGLPDSLLESELFGHLRGSFTDAHRDKAGILESASGGTVFLDEVGEMSARMQAVLLRFLETGELQRLGADRVHARSDVRIIAATNRDLNAEIDGGRFRQDLFYRLNVLRVHIPPLRDRIEDIPPLLDYFLDISSRQHRVPRSTLSPAVRATLTAYHWPGNVRQLRNVMERLSLKNPGAEIQMADLPLDVMTAPGTARTSGSSPVVDPLEEKLMAQILEGDSFWSVVFDPFMNRDLTREQVRGVVSRGLTKTAGSYRLTLRLFNMPDRDYKRFLGFLRKHHCQPSYRDFRQSFRPPVAA